MSESIEVRRKRNESHILGSLADQRGSLLMYSNLADILSMIPGSLIGGVIADWPTTKTGALFDSILFVIAAIVILSSLPVFYFIPGIQNNKS